MKLLQVALEKQNYNLAAYILVYGLIKAQVAPFYKYHGKKSKKRRWEK